MSNSLSKAPAVRIVKRGNEKKKSIPVIYFTTFILAAIVLSLMLLIMKFNPVKVFEVMIQGAFGKEFLVRETIKNTIPLVITSVGLSLAFKMKFWNIGGEGQILIGGIAATFVSFLVNDSIPQWILLILMALAAIVAAGIYGAVPAFFKAKFNTNETILTLMLNYVAMQIIILLQNTASWQDSTNSFPKIRMLSFYSRLPRIFGIHIGWIVAVVLLVVYYIYMEKTKHGYEIRIVGDSENTAKYAGINRTKVIIRTMFLSAALCGMAGYFQVAGADGTLSESTAGGIGFTAIMVSWMAEMRPVGMLVMSLLIAVLNRGADNLQTVFLIPSSFADIMIGIILLFMLVAKFMTNYKVVFEKGGVDK